MKKTILFGAGEGCKNYIKNGTAKRNFIAIVDNDKDRWGSFFENIKIIDPSTIKEFEFDEIVITTQWIDEVKKDLLKLGIDEKYIKIPQKRLLKKISPFLDAKTRESAAIILKHMAKTAYKDGVELFVDSGTLLGIIRDDGILPWDDDIDFSFDITKEKNKKFDILHWAKESIKKIPLHVKCQAIVTTDKNDKVVDISFDFYDNVEPFRVAINIRENKNGNSVEIARLGLFYAPAKFFSYPELYNWQDVTLQVPNHYEEYLEFVYGDWKTPKKNISLADYNHTGEVKFEDFKKVAFKQTKEEIIINNEK